MFTKSFFKNVIIFSGIVGGSLLALYLFDVYDQQRGQPQSSTSTFLETDASDSE